MYPGPLPKRVKKPRTPGRMEVRPGICRVTFEFPTELAARLDVAARTRPGKVSTSTLVRAVLTDWLLKHAKIPSLLPPIEVSEIAYEVASNVMGGNAAIENVFSKIPSVRAIEKITGGKT